MAGVELHNCNIKFMQHWNAGYDARLTAECWPGEATINLQLMLVKSYFKYNDQALLALGAINNVLRLV